MYKILIADDEPKIRKGLGRVIADMDLPIYVCGEAEDGEMALEQAHILAPDIILVDICMPFMDGLQFVHQLKKENIHSKVIVVTGYNEFDYAKESVRLKVCSYLLKPVDTMELEKVLGEIIGELDQDRQKNKHLLWASQQLEKRKEYLCEEFLREWLEGKLSDEELYEQLLFFSIQIQQLGLLVLIPQQNHKEVVPWTRELLVFAIDNIVRELFGEVPVYLFQDNRTNVTAVFEYSDKSKDLLLCLEETLGKYLDRKILALWTKVEETNQLNKAYEQLLDQAKQTAKLSPAVQFAQSFILKHYGDETLSLAQVADEANINPSYLSRLMKQELGLTFMEYLTRMRINKAIELMSVGGYKIRDISYAVGYSSPFYFSTVFKNMVGMPPANYIKEMEKK